MTAQAYRFDKIVFTVAEAKEWLKEHKVEYISFEPASKSLIQEFFEKLKL
jgi:arsenate reductase-like glutaredoxin family protein